ncbi:unnamed protein product [Caenorhabditis brenneri]
MDVPCSSNQKQNDDKNSNLFERRSTSELLNIIPECKGSKMMANLNEVFGIIEDKLGTMCRVITALMCNEGVSKVFSPSEVLRRVVEDCQTINGLMHYQKLKLAELGEGSPIPITAADAVKEHSMLRKLVSAKRKLPVSPWVIVEPDKKKRKLYDMMIENVYRSVYRDFLLFPSPILKLSEFVENMHSMTSPNRFSDDQVQFLIPELIRRKLINGFQIENSSNLIIVKEMNIVAIEPHMKRFSFTLEEYMNANVPNTLVNLNELVNELDESIIERMDTELWSSLANLIIATVIKDPKTQISHEDLPGKLPKSVMKAVTTLTQIGFLELCDNADPLVMKFAKRVNSMTLVKLGKVFGQPITCIRPLYPSAIREM